MHRSKRKMDQWTICGIRRAREKRHPKMYSQIKRMTKKSSKSANTALKEKANNIVFEKECILKRWTEYISELFIDDSWGDTINKHTLWTIWWGTNSSFRNKKGIKNMKNDNACGNDKILKEMKWKKAALDLSCELDGNCWTHLPSIELLCCTQKRVPIVSRQS